MIVGSVARISPNFKSLMYPYNLCHGSFCRLGPFLRGLIGSLFLRMFPSITDLLLPISPSLSLSPAACKPSHLILGLSVYENLHGGYLHFELTQCPFRLHLPVCFTLLPHLYFLLLLPNSQKGEIMS
jgi:hypothetical protein